jgi:hypothetical protein
MKCCLCGKEIEKIGNWKLGNNAIPIKKGRCGNKCNAEKVLPIRLFNLLKERIK